MPKGKPIPSDVRKSIYTSYTLGEKTKDIAERMDLSIVTVRKVIREQRKAYEKGRDEMSRSGKIVKKDGRGGKLIALSPEGFEFTHVTPDGKSHKKRVDGHISRVAESQYDAWCNQLDDEVAFMSMVERKEPEKPTTFSVDEEEPSQGETVEAETASEPDSEVTIAADRVYVIWAKCDAPKFYGCFTSMDGALEKLDELNDVAAFLGSDGVFEVEEVPMIL